MIGIIDYGINDTSELSKKLEELEIDFIKTKKESEITACDKIILSDADDLSKAVKRLHLFNLFSFIRLMKKPVLGISLGMELLCGKFNGVSCLGIFATDIIDNSEFSGWRNVSLTAENLLFRGIENNSEFYFENDYHINLNSSTVASVNNAEKFSAALIKDNFYAVQFLPEKSGEQGGQLLKNFATLS